MSKIKVQPEAPAAEAALLKEWTDRVSFALSLERKQKLNSEDLRYLLSHLLDHYSYNATLRVCEQEQLGYQTSPFMLTKRNSYARTDRNQLHSLLLATCKTVYNPPPIPMLRETDVLPGNSRSFFTQFYDFWDLGELAGELSSLNPVQGAQPIDLTDRVVAILIKRSIWLNDFDPQLPQGFDYNPLDSFFKWIISKLPVQQETLSEVSGKNMGNEPDVNKEQILGEVSCYCARTLPIGVEVIYMSKPGQNYKQILAQSGFYLTKHEAHSHIANLMLSKFGKLQPAIINVLALWSEINEKDTMVSRAAGYVKDKVAGMGPFRSSLFASSQTQTPIDDASMISALKKSANDSSQQKILKNAMVQICVYIVSRSSGIALSDFISKYLSDEVSLFCNNSSGFVQKTRCLQNVQELLLLTLKILPDNNLDLSRYCTGALPGFPNLAISSYTVGFGMQGYYAIGYKLMRLYGHMPRFAMFSENYFEATALMSRMSNEPHTPVVKGLFSLDQVQLESTDVIVIDFHPNNAMSDIIQQHRIAQWLSRNVALLVKPLTIIIDVTINRLDDQEIRDTIQVLHSHENARWLNIALIQSLTKFAQLGSDILSGGVFTIINRREGMWVDFNNNIAVDLQVRALPDHAQQYFCFHLDRLRLSAAPYFNLVQQNTNFLFDFAKDLCDKLPLNINYKAMRLQVKADDENCYIAFDFNEYFKEFRRGITNKTIAYFMSFASYDEIQDFLECISEPDLNFLMNDDAKKTFVRKKADHHNFRVRLGGVNHKEFYKFLDRSNRTEYDQHLDEIKGDIKKIIYTAQGRSIIQQILTSYPSLAKDLLLSMDFEVQDEHDRRLGEVNKLQFLFSMLDEDDHACLVKALLSLNEKRDLFIALYRKHDTEFRCHPSDILLDTYRSYFDKYLTSRLLKDVMRYLIYPLICQNQLPVTFRLSIGFLLSVISECGTAIRFSVGIELKDIMTLYGELIAQVTFLLNMVDDPMSLMLANKRREYFRNAIFLCGKFKDSNDKKTPLEIGEIFTVREEVIVGVNDEGDPIDDHIEVGLGKLVVFRKKGHVKAENNSLLFVDNRHALNPNYGQEISIFQWRRQDFTQLTLAEQLHFICAVSFKSMSIQKEYAGLQLYGYDNNNWEGMATATIQQNQEFFKVFSCKGQFDIHSFGRGNPFNEAKLKAKIFSADKIIFIDPTKADGLKVPLSRLKQTHKHVLFSGLFFNQKVITNAPLRFEEKGDTIRVYKIMNL
jgi:hypothetical protein